MKIEECNFVVTKDEATRNELLKNGFIELQNTNGDLYVFVNDPKKFAKFNFEEMPIRFTNKLYF